MSYLIFIFSVALAGFFSSPQEDLCKNIQSDDDKRACFDAIKSLEKASSTRQELCKHIAKTKVPAFFLSCVSAELTPQAESRCHRLTNAGRYKAASICIKTFNETDESQVDENKFRQCLAVTNFNDGREDRVGDGSNFEGCMKNVVNDYESGSAQPKPQPSRPRIQF